MSAAMKDQPTRHPHYRPSDWTETQIKSLAVMWADATISKQDIAEELKHSVSACEKKATLQLLGKRPQIRTARGISPQRTDKRKALLMELYPIGEDVKIILEKMNKLPGAEITSTTYIGLWASGLNLRRPNDLKWPGPKTKSRDRVAEQIKAQQLKVERTALIERQCLSCSRKFGAATRFVRLCSPCKSNAHSW